MKGKYVITRYSPILFNEAMNHNDFARCEVVSAGFFHVSCDENGKLKVVCYGESQSLKLKSQPDIDAKKIKALLLGVPLGMLED